MKRTTYVFIGVFVATIVLSTIYLLYMNSVAKSAGDVNLTFDFGKERTSIDLDEVHTLEFSMQGVAYDEFYFLNRGIVEITSLASEGRSKASYPVSDYLKLEKENGVLKVILDFTQANMSGASSRFGRGLLLENLTIDIEVGRSLKYVSGTDGFVITAHQIQQDSLHLVSGNVEMGSCEIQHLYVDLDGMQRWNIEGSSINTLHLTGSGNNYGNLPLEQCKQIEWEPKQDGALLEVKLSGRTRITIN